MAAAPSIAANDGRASFFLPFAKVDPDQHMVWGWASTPVKDLQKEIVPIDAIKAALPDYLPWSNVREMHELSAVGVCKHAEIIEGGDKDQEGLYIGAKIVDPLCWDKIKEGVYKGFSIGGEILEKTGDTINRLNLIEISVVDRPANPQARIEYFKAVGLGRTAAGANAVAAEEPTFDRLEVGLLGRIIAKLGGRSAKSQPTPTVVTDDYARDGFSRPAAVETPAEPSRALRGPDGTIQQTPGGFPNSAMGAMAPFPGYDLDLPQEARNRIVAMGGNYHVFGDNGEHLRSYVAPHEAAEHAKAYIEAAKALDADAEFSKDDKPKGEYGTHSEAGYADPGYQADKKPRYPLKERGKFSEQRIRAAWSYIHQEKNREPYTAEQLKNIERRVIAAWKAKIDPKGPPAAQEKAAGIEPSAKTITTDLSDVVAQVRNLARDIEAEGEEEGGDPRDDALADRASHLADLLAEFNEHQDLDNQYFFHGVTAEARKAMSKLGQMLKALVAGDANFGAMFKRFSEAHKGAIRKVAHHIHKAMEFHKVAMGHHHKMAAHHGKALESLHKAAEHLAKCQELHKAHFGKAAGEAYPHEEMAQHLQHVEDAMHEAVHQHLRDLATAHRAAHEAHQDTHDQHELAKESLGKVAAGWVGETGESPADAESGLYEPEGGISNTPQSHMTEGDVPGYDPFSPYPTKSAGARPAAGGAMDEQSIRLREENAYLRGQLEAQGNQPVEPRGKLFAVEGASPARRESETAKGATSLIDQIAANPLDVAKLSDDMRSKLVAKALGLQAVAHQLPEGHRDMRFVRDGTDPRLLTPAETRGKAAGSNVFNPLGAPGAATLRR